MNKFTFKLLVLPCILLGGFSKRPSKLFEHPDLETIAQDHKILAIIPFSAKVSLRPKQMKEITPKQLKESEIGAGHAIQNPIFTWFLKAQKN